VDKNAKRRSVYLLTSRKGGIMAGKFELKKGKSGKFSFNLKAANGQVILSSQTYKTKAAAKNGIKSVCTNCKKASFFEQKASKKGQPYFVLLAANKQVVGKSQMYASKKSMLNGIASVKKNAAKSKIQDLTA
jgi:uncharacterized protein YegP (UPF0339 family)